MTITRHITIDLVKKLVTPRVYVMQYDTNTRIVEIQLTANGEKWAPPEGVSFALSYRKPDGKRGFYNKLSEEVSAVTVEENKVSVTLATQVLTTPGVVDAALVMNNADMDRLASFPFEIHVDADPSAGTTQSDDYFNCGTATKNAVLYTPQEPTPEEQAQARENIGITNDPDIHAEYFTTTEDGVLSLKPEYRGASTVTEFADSISDMGSGVAGSKNAELPKYLVIPETVNGTLADSLADGVFAQNLALEQVVLPSTISVLPANCFCDCYNLRDVYNTERITSIGDKGFRRTAIKRACFPSLQTLGVSAFQSCGYLVYADIGKVSDVPKQAFVASYALNALKNSGTITSVGDNAFNDTFSLKRAAFIKDVTNIGKYAFYSSKIDYPWETLTGCTFGNGATSLKLNPADIWSNISFTPCENRVPTHLSQRNPLWTDSYISTSQKTYGSGCALFVAMHIYCGIKNLTLSSPTEFVDIVNAVDTSLLSNFTGDSTLVATILTALGLNATHYRTYNAETLQALYNALANGGYAYVSVGSGSAITGHAVTVCGIDSNGELMIVDSESNAYDDRSIPIPKYALHFKKFLVGGIEYPENSGFIIVTP